MLPFLLTIVMAGCGDARREPPAAELQLAELLGGTDTLHARATAPVAFTFPRDHGAHPEFRTEWWYFTGNLTARDGRDLGYQLTFFRSALLDSASYLRSLPEDDSSSDWRTRHAYMAHLAVTDAQAQSFEAHERFARGAAGLAGVETAPLRIRLHDWCACADSGSFPLRLVAAAGDIAIDLTLEPLKPPVLQGNAGLSAKGPEPGNASYYYSLTRIATRGTVRLGGTTHEVSGLSWLDREWSTSVLGSGVVGWDWLSLQLSDTTELMMYRLRREDGTPDAFSAASFVRPDGANVMFDAAGFTMQPRREWRSPSGAAYPVEWSLQIPALDLTLDVRAAVPAQELNLYVRYWEGMVRASGTRAGRGISGRGYLEMTGYAGDEALRGR
jgi:predicted secreted hydrolase